MFVKWRKEFSVGVDALDDQHREILALINHLHEAIKSDTTDKAIGEITERLVAYTQTHFTDEEEHMSKIGYRGLEAHRKEHEDIKSRVGELQKKMNNGEITVMEVSVFLKQWFSNHILEVDRKYSQGA
ncbi:MAG: hemerythrin family protein [Deltaproteobacteria bacterium]|nr:hemerythrin family protein [Deltaproteobacteria bacterium]